MLTPKEAKLLNFIHQKLNGAHNEYTALFKLLKEFWGFKDDLAFELAYLYDKNFDQSNGDFKNVTDPDRMSYQNYMETLPKLTAEEVKRLNTLFSELNGETKSIREITAYLQKQHNLGAQESIRNACLYFYNYDKANKISTDQKYFDSIVHSSPFADEILLLEYINNGRAGAFKSYIDALNNNNPNILWYPSAGRDFDSLLYLSKLFTKKNNLAGQIPPEPDLFIFTDLYQNLNAFHNKIYFKDSKTKFRIIESEKLDNLNIPNYPELGLVEHQEVMFYIIEVSSVELGVVYKCPVLYITAENGSFLKNILLKYNIQVSHLIHTTWGMGSSTSGSWLLYVLNLLSCKFYISNSLYDAENLRDADNIMLDLLGRNLTPTLLKSVATLPTGGYRYWNVINDAVISNDNINSYDRGYRPITEQECERLELDEICYRIKLYCRNFPSGLLEYYNKLDIEYKNNPEVVDHVVYYSPLPLLIEYIS